MMMIRAFILACLALTISAQTPGIPSDDAVCGQEFLALFTCALTGESTNDSTDDTEDLCDICLENYFEDAGSLTTCAQADEALSNAFDNCSNQCFGDNDPCGETLRNYWKCFYEIAVDANCNSGGFIGGSGNDSSGIATGLVFPAAVALIAVSALVI